jgi:hypothetical protein
MVIYISIVLGFEQAGHFLSGWFIHKPWFWHSNLPRHSPVGIMAF